VRSLLILALLTWLPLRLAEDERRRWWTHELLEVVGSLPAIAYAINVVLRARRPRSTRVRQAPALHLVVDRDGPEPGLRPTAHWS